MNSAAQAAKATGRIIRDCIAKSRLNDLVIEASGMVFVIRLEMIRMW